METEILIYKHVCEKCDYKCNYESEWVKHCNTELHITGKRKKRIDSKEASKCVKCDYKSKNKTTLKQHYLNEHGTKVEREKEFKYYCKICDLGTFSKDIYNNHINSEKHKKHEKRL